MSAVATAELPRASWDTAEIVEWLRASDAVCEAARRPYVELFLNCLRFWAGDQWRDIVGSELTGYQTRDIPTLGTQDWRLVDNQVPIYCRHLVATATANMPRLECVPEDATEPLDVFAAQAGTRFLDWRHRKDHEPWLREMEWLWMLGTGECLRQTTYDAEGGDPLYGEGDILTRTIDPFRYLKDPQSVLEWPPRFLTVREARHVDWIKEHLGVTVEPESVADVQQYYDSLAMNVVSGQRQQREPLKNAAIVWQRFIPPGKRYPQGWLYVRVGTKLVRSHALQGGQWPFARGGWSPLPGRMYPMGLIELMMGDQKQLNALVSLLYEAAGKAVRGDRTVTGPVADPRSIREFVHNKRTGGRTTIYPPGVTDMPTRYEADWQQGAVQVGRIDQNLHRKSGANEPSLGQPIGRGDTTATEWLGSREGDTIVGAWHLGRYADQHLTEVDRQKLLLAKEYYVLPRRLEGLGAKNALIWFQGADLRDTKDVVTVATAHMTPAMKQQASAQAYGAQMLGPYESLAHRYAAWTALRRQGLDDLVEEMEAAYGSFEELEGQVRELAQGQVEAEKMALADVLAGPQGMAAGQPEPSAGQGAPRR